MPDVKYSYSKWAIAGILASAILFLVMFFMILSYRDFLEYTVPIIFLIFSLCVASINIVALKKILNFYQYGRTVAIVGLLLALFLVFISVETIQQTYWRKNIRFLAPMMPVGFSEPSNINYQRCGGECGKISVTFGDDVTGQEALNLLKNIGISVSSQDAEKFLKNAGGSVALDFSSPQAYEAVKNEFVNEPVFKSCQESPDERVATLRVICYFGSNHTKTEVLEVASRYPMAKNWSAYTSRYLTISVPEGEENAWIAKLKQYPQIEYAEHPLQPAPLP